MAYTDKDLQRDLRKIVRRLDETAGGGRTIQSRRSLRMALRGVIRRVELRKQEEK